MLDEANSKLDDIRTEMANLTNDISTLEPGSAIDGTSTLEPRPATDDNYTLEPCPGMDDNYTSEPCLDMDNNSHAGTGSSSTETNINRSSKGKKRQLSIDHTNERLPLDSDHGGRTLRSRKHLCVPNSTSNFDDIMAQDESLSDLSDLFPVNDDGEDVLSEYEDHGSDEDAEEATSGTYTPSTR